MVATAPEYEPAWLQGDDVFDAFEATGIDRPAAAEWLAGAHHDRGLALAKDADPTRDLFRLPWGASLDTGISDFGVIGRIDWHKLTVNALYSGHYVPLPIEVSRVLLADLLPKPMDGKGKGGRKPVADWYAIEEAVHVEIKNRGWPDDDNADPKWRSQSDVERFVSGVLVYRKERGEEATIRRHVKEILNKIKARN